MMKYSLAYDEIFSKESGHFACQCDNGYEGDPPLLFCRRSDEYEVFSMTQSRAHLMNDENLADNTYNTFLLNAQRNTFWCNG